MPRWSPLAQTICYGRVERSIRDWMDMVPLMEWVSYFELLYHVYKELSGDPTPDLRPVVSRACKHLEQDIHCIERYPQKRAMLIRRII